MFESLARGVDEPVGDRSPSPGSAGAPSARRVSPLTGAVLPPLAASTPDQIRTAVAAARLAQPEWASRSLADRFAALQRVAKAMIADRATVVALVKEEMGKHEAEGIFTEGLGPLDAVSSWRTIVADATARDVRLNPMSFPKKRARTLMVPRGVVGIIAPWNYPVSGLYRSIFPALLTGNAVILKPSEYTTRASTWFIDHLARELPLGVAQALTGDGEVGRRLIEGGIDACVFTGSTATGARVRVRCAELGIVSSVEMGGKDAAIVLADCDLERTAAGVTQWALSNSGQACGAIEVAYVDERIADAFVERLRRAWERLRTGPGAEDVEIHPIGNLRQLEIIEAHVADATAKGARLVCGGKRTGQGLGYLPTLLDRCTAAMDVVREETFGPVLAVVRFKGVDEAVRAINGAKYGLGASIWTGDVPRAERLAERLDVGVVDVNNHAFTGAIAALPWSGTRATGNSVANSEWSLLTFCRPKAITVDSGDDPELFWMPFDRDARELFDLLGDVQVGRLLGAWKIPLLIRRRLAHVRSFFR
jgi:acyl-CoA reductase-like NAD-dependent aldehyde dehydrogenase